MTANPGRPTIGTVSKEDKLPNAVEPWHSRWVELRAQLDAVIEWMDEREGEAEEHADAEAWGLVKAGIDRAFRDGQDVLPLQIPADRCPAWRPRIPAPALPPISRQRCSRA